MLGFLADGQRELEAELALEGGSVVPDDVEPTARFRSRQSKRSDDEMAAQLERASEILDVRSSLGCCGEKVEHSSVVPDVEGVGGELGRGDVALNPRHATGGVSEP